MRKAASGGEQSLIMHIYTFTLSLALSEYKQYRSIPKREATHLCKAKRRLARTRLFVAMETATNKQRERFSPYTLAGIRQKDRVKTKVYLMKYEMQKNAYISDCNDLFHLFVGCERVTIENCSLRL